MMDPATARVALKLQLDDVDTILKTLSPASNDPVILGELAAFRSLREDLLRKWHEFSGQCFAYNILKEENNNRTAFKRLLNEEQQAERDHDMACRLAGKPVPQRATLSNKRGADDEIEGEAINGSTTTAKKLPFDLSGTQADAGLTKPLKQLKRPAKDQITSGADKKAATKSAMAGKQTTVEDAPDEVDPKIMLGAKTSVAKKRDAVLDPAILREHDDGRTKRAKSDSKGEESLPHLDSVAATKTRAHDENSATPSGKVNAIIQGTCSSCLDMHPSKDMLQLPCNDDGDRENHAYCRDCLRRLFESSVTDPSHFPPRCCSKIIPLFNCTPFLPQSLITRFVARREELGTVNRTYCSNNNCSQWIRPANIEANVARCTECAQETCTTCKGKQHVGLCPEDKDVKSLMTVAKQKHWQTCPNCKELVELERGCYHITCRCREQFCYLCVKKWKTCKCPVWDERNIINVAQPAAGQPAPAPAPFGNVAPAPFGGAAPVQANAVPQVFGVPVPAPVPNPAPAPFGLPVPVPFGNGAPAQVDIAPHVFGNPFFAPLLPQAQAQQPRHSQGPSARTKRLRDQRNRNRPPAHEHDFERYYHSNGWNTTCHLCGHEDRWVNCCSECDLKVCWYCTKHRV